MPGARVVILASGPSSMTVALDDGEMVQLDAALASGIIVRA